jgi:hypothetical protein
LPAEVQGWYEPKQHGIYLRSSPSGSYFEMRTARADKPQALAGVHSANVLLIADEASDVPESVYEAAVGSMSGPTATTLLIGNPVHTSGLFFDTHHKLKDMWHTIHVSHKDSSRVTDDFVEDVRRRYGENSNAFRVRALGEFPLTDSDTVIPWELVESARNREVEDSPRAPRVWGLDVARYGSDRCALSERTARNGRVLDVWTHHDLMATTGRVVKRWKDLPEAERPDVILVDSIGLGSGVVDRMYELNLPVRGINVAEVASMSEQFARARSELWWNCREWLAKQDVALAADPEDPEGPNETLARELVVPKYKFTSNGNIEVEPKSATKKRTRSSPDVADSFILTFAEDLSMLLHGSMGGTTSWNEPITRGLSIP